MFTRLLATHIVNVLQTAQAMCTVLGVTLTRVPNSVLRSKFVSSVQLLGKVVAVHRQQVRRCWWRAIIETPATSACCRLDRACCFSSRHVFSALRHHTHSSW